MKRELLYFLSIIFSVANDLSFSQDPSAAYTILPRSICCSKLGVVADRDSRNKCLLSACSAEAVTTSDVEGPVCSSSVDGETLAMSQLVAAGELGMLAGDFVSCVLGSTLILKIIFVSIIILHS